MQITVSAARSAQQICWHQQDLWTEPLIKQGGIFTKIWDPTPRKQTCFSLILQNMGFFEDSDSCDMVPPNS